MCQIANFKPHLSLPEKRVPCNDFTDQKNTESSQNVSDHSTALCMLLTPPKNELNS
jgi:hypothetical protein